MRCNIDADKSLLDFYVEDIKRKHALSETMQGLEHRKFCKDAKWQNTQFARETVGKAGGVGASSIFAQSVSSMCSVGDGYVWFHVE